LIPPAKLPGRFSCPVANRIDSPASPGSIDEELKGTLFAMRYFRINLPVVLFLLMLHVTASAQNSCVQCHEAMKEPSLKEFHKNWKASIHAQRGVTCEYCHGGDKEKKSMEKAHLGVYPALRPESSVYYRKIPALCGGCHRSEFLEFSKSRHSPELMDKGVGPNCVTCHDAMSTKILKPGEIEIFCSLCHNAESGLLPGATSSARSVLEQMESVGNMIERADNLLAQARKRGANIEKSDGFLSLAKKELSACKQDWHAFQLERVTLRLRGAGFLIDRSLESLDNK